MTLIAAAVVEQLQPVAADRKGIARTQRPVIPLCAFAPPRKVMTTSPTALSTETSVFRDSRSCSIVASMVRARSHVRRSARRGLFRLGRGMPGDAANDPASIGLVR
ncbi:MAG: hypothetical protein R3B90_10130 [Planctomycetaceae bacterium]